MRPALLVAAILMGGGAAGCAQPPPPRPMPMPPSLTLESAVQAALADAARRSGLAIEALQLRSAEAVTWPDGALGCPEPGRAYTQARVAGYRVRVLAAGLELDYHAGQRGTVSLCPAGRAVEPLPDDAQR